MTDQPQGPTQPPPPESPSAAPQSPDAGGQPGAYAAPQQASYAPPAANPYGGYTQAPAYAGGRPVHPGSIGYVEQYFGTVATFGQRALALIIDTLLMLIGLIPMVIGIVVVGVSAPRDSGMYDDFGAPVTSGGNGAGIATGVILIVLGGLLTLAISLWNRVWRMGRTGQSVGKKAMNLRLVDDKTGQPIGAGMCFLREVVSGIVNQVVYLSYLWMLWDTEKQTLADKAVHSTVVVLPRRA